MYHSICWVYQSIVYTIHISNLHVYYSIPQYTIQSHSIHLFLSEAFSKGVLHEFSVEWCCKLAEHNGSNQIWKQALLLHMSEKGRPLTERHTWYNHLSWGGRACLLAAGIPVSALLRLELGQTASWQQNTCTQELAGRSTHNRNRARKIASYPGRPGYKAQWCSESWAWHKANKSVSKTMFVPLMSHDLVRSARKCYQVPSQYQ